MLRLQDGHFDNPDRLFTEIADTWRGCLVNHADLKEVIDAAISYEGFLACMHSTKQYILHAMEGNARRVIAYTPMVV